VANGGYCCRTKLGVHQKSSSSEKFASLLDNLIYKAQQALNPVKDNEKIEHRVFCCLNS
jgi:hypothetical protein